MPFFLALKKKRNLEVNNCNHESAVDIKESNESQRATKVTTSKNISINLALSLFLLGMDSTISAIGIVVLST